MNTKTKKYKRWNIYLVFGVIFGLMMCTTKTDVIAGDGSPGKGFVSLFNGKDLTGWTVEPDNGTYFVKDGALVCNAKKSPPYEAYSEKQYENFILELDYKIAKNGNSGIFLHAPPWGRQSRVGFELQICDTDKEPTKHSTGAIYDVLPAKKIVPVKVGDWNHVRVRFDWPKAKVWWNGELIHDVDCTQNEKLKYRLRQGFIGLQNHGAYVEFKNFWIKELPSKEKWTGLFNGKELAGWAQVGDANWHVEDGAIVATEGSGFLVSKEKFENFEFQAYVERGQIGYGGIYYRWQNSDDPGYEAEYFNYADALKFTQNGENAPPNTMPPFGHEYLLMQIISHHRESLVRINGLSVSSRINHTKIRPGHFAIQFHPDNDVLWIRDVRIKKAEF